MKRPLCSLIALSACSLFTACTKTMTHSSPTTASTLLLPAKHIERFELAQPWFEENESQFRQGFVELQWTPHALLVHAKLADEQIYTSSDADNQHMWELGDVFEVFLQVEGHEDYFELHITRDYRFASDHFITEDLRLEIISPFGDLPDPATTARAKNKRAACPVVFAKLTVDNRQGTQTKTALFALGEHGCPMPIHEPGKFTGFLFGNGNLGFATDAEVEPLQTFDLSKAKKPDGTQLVPRFGGSYGFMMDVPAGEQREMHISLATYRTGIATLGLEMPYWYTRYFSSLRDVLEYGLEHKDWYYQQAAQRDAELEAASLNDAQKFLIAHASHSYYGSTQWFDDSGKPFWNVNEGEYRMHNTFDLTVDMLFYEMRYSPWTVKNVLETFIRRYSYYDQVRLPGSDRTYPGGISFTHDQGNHNNFSPEAYSSYEISGIDRRCFSYMTHEQLVNWVCCTGVYVSQSQDQDFLTRHLKTVKDCYQSMLNRDHPAPAQRNGVMGCESSRCNGGGEIMGGLLGPSRTLPASGRAHTSSRSHRICTALCPHHQQ